MRLPSNFKVKQKTVLYVFSIVVAFLNKFCFCYDFYVFTLNSICSFSQWKRPISHIVILFIYLTSLVLCFQQILFYVTIIIIIIIVIAAKFVLAQCPTSYI